METIKKFQFVLVLCAILVCLANPAAAEPEIMGLSKFSGEKYAILVGIEDYANLGDLENCDDDARDMRALLLGPECGFSYGNIELLLNSQATRNNIKGAIERVSTQAGPEDLVVFYFSGHGSFGEDLPPYDEYSDGLDEYICPQDSRYSGKVNYIRDDELKIWFDAIPANHKLLIFDSCYSGGMAKSAEPELLSDKRPVSDFMRDFLDDRGGIGPSVAKDVSGSPYLVLAACREYEESSAGTPNSIFTFFLLQAFDSIAADTDNDGWISAEEAFYYAEPRAVEFIDSEMPQRPMHPQIYDGSDEEIELVSKGGTLPTTVPTTVPTTAVLLPDLVVQSVAIGTDAPVAGQRISVRPTVRNTGSGYALPSTASVYLSTDQVISAGDTLLGHVPVGMLPGGQSSTGTIWVTIPSNLGPGDYYIGVVADGMNTIAESNENNNTNHAKIRISGGQTMVPTTVPTTQPTSVPTTVPTTAPATSLIAPDLVVESVTPGTSSPYAGQRIAVTARIRNQGGGYAMPNQAYVYLSRDTTITPADTYLGTISTGLLLSGRISTGTTWVTIPSNLGPGDYYIGVVADGLDTVSESNENNNANYAKIRISGGQTTVPTTFPTTIPTAVPTTQPTSVPTTAPTISPTMSLTAPDLVVESVTPGTSSPYAGQRIAVTARIRNQGGGYAMPNQAYVYLSRDTTITPADTYLGTISTGLLLSGRISTGTTWVTIPSNLGPGDYYIGVVADGMNTIAESNENNNTNHAKIRISGGQTTVPTTVPTTHPTSVPTTVPTTAPTTSLTAPDLVVESVTPGTSSPYAGQRISVNVRIGNEGRAHAMPNQAYVYLSRDTTISPADTYLGQIPFSIVLSGRSSSRTGYMTVPYGTAPGVCYLGVVADGSNTVSEINEHNNTNYAMVQVKG